MWTWAERVRRHPATSEFSVVVASWTGCLWVSDNTIATAIVTSTTMVYQRHVTSTTTTIYSTASSFSMVVIFVMITLFTILLNIKIRNHQSRDMRMMRYLAPEYFVRCTSYFRLRPSCFQPIVATTWLPVVERLSRCTQVQPYHPLGLSYRCLTARQWLTPELWKETASWIYCHHYHHDHDWLLLYFCYHNHRHYY